MDIKKVDNSIALCPICNGSYYKVKELDVNFIKNKLSQHFNNRIDEGVEIIDYTLLKCNDCSFEYSFPLTEGSSSFYNWVTSQLNYYPDTRWEYSKVLDLITNKNKQSKLLDIGCGDGRFLDFLHNSKNTGIEYFGLDPTKGSVEKCLQKGHNVYCMDIQEFKSTHTEEYFDAITIFHVLEHIANPKDFLKELVGLTSPGGQYMQVHLIRQWILK